MTPLGVEPRKYTEPKSVAFTILANYSHNPTKSLA